ncbi:MAG: DegT/DnrJ/EryC1/StrS family aminotransferase [Candidatus Latescibacterota bacterium]
MGTTTKELIQMPGIQTRLNEEEEQTLLRVLREANTLSAGPEGAAFEEEFTAFIGSADSVAVNSCSSALELAAVLSDVGPGDEVIVPAHTFVATAVPFARHGVTIRWADIDPDTRVVSAQSIAKLITPKTKVIVVVHLYGLAADMDPIMELAKKHSVIVVEDCAQAPGAHYKGRRVGAIGHFGCFSFHTHKNMNTLGEGGMLTEADPRHGVAARRLRWMGNWPFEGERERYWKPAMGDVVEPVAGRWPFNYCMGEPNCAVGRVQLTRLDAINAQRQRQARRFTAALGAYPELSFQHVPEGCEHVYHLMPARYDGQAFGKHRDDLLRKMFEEQNLKCIVQYWPLNRTDLFAKFGWVDAEVPETDRYFDNMLGFPWWSDMPDEVIDEMAGRTCAVLEELRAGK